MFQFTRRLIQLRNEYPILRRQRFMTGEWDEDLQVRDVTWVNETGSEMRQSDWQAGPVHCLGMLMDGRAKVSGIRRPGTDATLLMILNAYHDLLEFVMPPCAGGAQWQLLLDTNRPDHAVRPFLCDRQRVRRHRAIPHAVPADSLNRTLSGERDIVAGRCCRVT